MARLLSSLPMDEALEKAKAYGPEVRKRLLSQLGANSISSPGERDAFLAKLTSSGSDPKDSAAGLKGLIAHWGKADPAAALEGMKNLSLDEKAKQEQRKQIIIRWTHDDPAAAFAWMNSDKNSQPLGNVVEVYRNWAEMAPDDAVKQFEILSHQTPGFRDEVIKSLLTSYYQGGWIPFGRSERTDGVIFSRLKIHYDQWSTSDPGQASTWLGSLEPALQQRLTTPDRHETN